MTTPTPRLRDCPVGARIRIVGERKDRVIVHKCDRYAYFDLYQASLCCEVPTEYMVFGEGGWKAAY